LKSNVYKLAYSVYNCSIILQTPKTIKEGLSMKKYVCSVCGWEYDEAEGAPEYGIAPGTKWEDVPEDFTCPMCGAGKEEFEEA
jgi:rubredoxin-NAD+ reductase